MISLPSSVQFRPQSLYGIVLGVYPSTAGRFDVVMEQATANSTSVTWTQVLRAPPTQANDIKQILLTPNDGKTRWFRAYQIAPGYAQSAYTAAVSAVPKPLNAQAFAGPSDVLGSTVALVTPTTKSLRLTHAEAIPKNSTAKWVAYVASYKPNTTGVNLEFVMPFTMPQGVTIKSVSIRTLRTGSGSTATYQFSRTLDNGSGVLLASVLVGTTATGYKTVTTSALAEQVTSTRGYVLRGFIKTTSITAGVGSEFVFADVKYTVPRISQTL